MGVTGTIRRFMVFALKADHFGNRSDSAVPDRANIVSLYIGNRRARRRPGKRAPIRK
jgi:hypothetical protein